MNARTAADRYVSFEGIDFEANMGRVIGHIARYLDGPVKGNPFWQRFADRMAAADAGGATIADKLLVLHAHVYYMVELFEDHDDEEALKDLQKLERECF